MNRIRPLVVLSAALCTALVGCHRSLQVGEPATDAGVGDTGPNLPAYYLEEPEIPVPVPTETGVESVSVHNGRLLIQYGQHVHVLTRQGEGFALATDQAIRIADEGEPRLVPGTDIAFGGWRGESSYCIGYAACRAWTTRIHADMDRPTLALQRVSIDNAGNLSSPRFARNSTGALYGELQRRAEWGGEKVAFLVDNVDNNDHWNSAGYRQYRDDENVLTNHQTVVAFGERFVRVRKFTRRLPDGTYEYPLDLAVLKPALFTPGDASVPPASTASSPPATTSPWQSLLEIPEMWRCDGGLQAVSVTGGIIVACAYYDSRIASRRNHTSVFRFAVRNGESGLIAEQVGERLVAYDGPDRSDIFSFIAESPTNALLLVEGTVYRATLNSASLESLGELGRGIETATPLGTHPELSVPSSHLLVWHGEIWAVGGEGIASTGPPPWPMRSNRLVLHRLGAEPQTIAVEFPPRGGARMEALTLHGESLLALGRSDAWIHQVSRLTLGSQVSVHKFASGFLFDRARFVNDADDLYLFDDDLAYQVGNEALRYLGQGVTVHQGRLVAGARGRGQCPGGLCVNTNRYSEDGLALVPTVYDVRGETEQQRPWQTSDLAVFPRCEIVDDNDSRTYASPVRNPDGGCNDEWHPFQSAALRYQCPYDGRQDQCRALLARSESPTHVAVVEERARLDNPTRVVVRLYAQGSTTPIATRTLIDGAGVDGQRAFIEHVRGGLFAVGYARWDSNRGMVAPFVHLLYFPEADAGVAP